MPPFTVSAAREVPFAPGRVYGFLAQMDNHWNLGGRYLRVERLDEDRRGGRILITAPLGLRRTARTTVTTEHEPHRFGGIARVGRTTRAHVQWRIEPAQPGARVTLESRIYSAGVIDRGLLALGGRWWLRRAFRRALSGLADALDGYAAAPLGRPVEAPSPA